jgi:hypothetical protein
MADMMRLTPFLLTLLAPCVVLAQVPPGEPFDPVRHPNPIVTFVESTGFNASTYAEAAEAAGIDLLGLSEPEAVRDSIQLARGGIRRTRIGPLNTDVTYYAVVRQVFNLSDGGALVLHSFKFPRLGIPANDARVLLNQAAIEKKKDPREMRFGGAAPEDLDIRGREALLFERDGEITVFWVEEGVGHTVTARAPRRVLFRLIEDLL